MSGEQLTDDYRELINEKFKGIFGRIDAYNEMQHNKLDAILLQTTKTNGKVAELEQRMRDVETFQNKCQMPEVRREVDQLMKETAASRAIWGNPTLNKWLNMGKLVAALGALGSLFYLIIKVTA